MLRNPFVGPGVTKVKFIDAARLLAGGLLIACVWSLSLGLLSAEAQSASPQQVLDLNRRAVESYGNLDVVAAEAALLQAAKLAENSKVPAAIRARTYLNLATVYVGGMQDNARGLNYAVRALEVDPSVEPDPLMNTPEVRAVFRLARSKTSGGLATVAAKSLASPASGPGNIPHTPVPEQLVQTAVPVFIEVPEQAKVGPIYVHYKGYGMDEYKRLQMKRFPGGFGAEIPCADVYEPAMRYYIVAHAPDGSPLGFTATPRQPIEVPIVAQRKHPAPALPGRKPAAQCVMKDCPPSMPDCRLGKAMPEEQPDQGPLACVTSADCRGGQVCDRGSCVAAVEPKSASANKLPRFFFLSMAPLAWPTYHPDTRPIASRRVVPQRTATSLTRLRVKGDAMHRPVHIASG